MSKDDPFVCDYYPLNIDPRMIDLLRNVQLYLLVRSKNFRQILWRFVQCYASPSKTRRIPMLFVFSRARRAELDTRNKNSYYSKTE